MKTQNLKLKTQNCEELEKQLEETANNWKRALADYQNLEKRTGEEKLNFAQFANSQLVLNLLPVLDSLDQLVKLDKFVKHKLKAKHYIRYVDDFILISSSKEQLKIWKNKINRFLENELKLKLHPEKSRIISLSNGVDFVGFRNFYHHKLLRKRNIRNMKNKIRRFSLGKIAPEKMAEIFQGWNAYAKWADSYKLREHIRREMLNLINPLCIK